MTLPPRYRFLTEAERRGPKLAGDRWWNKASETWNSHHYGQAFTIGFLYIRRETEPDRPYVKPCGSVVEGDGENE
jgi:hypothetical protein